LTTRLYRIANTQAQVELVKATKVVSADYIETEGDLQYDYGSGDALRGVYCTFTIDSTFIADKTKLNDPLSPYRVLWSYTLNSISRKHTTYFDVVRQAKQHGVNHFDLMEAWPDLWAQQPESTRGQAWANFLDAAVDRVHLDLKTRSIDPNQVRDAEVIDELIRQAAYMLLAQAGITPQGRDTEQFVQERMQMYGTDLQNAVQSMLVSQNTTGANTREPIRQLLFRR
jgi:hypothetical protein